ncbi:MAG: hypothetical protein PHQ98_04550 [Candidatus ainarchaeum sp.]|nr:hypothetical protein [Candidatus ainarchaeum sp.]
MFRRSILLIIILVLSIFVSATFMHQPGCEEICENEFTDELTDVCLEEFGDYPYLGTECLSEHIGDYAQECLDEFNDYVDDEGADPSAAEQCLEDNSDYYSQRCVEDFEDESKELCWDWFGDYMISNCDQYIDDSLVRGTTPECCEYEDQFYVDELGECLDYEQAVCQELGMCQYDGDDYCSGLFNQDDECVSFEQSYCEEIEGIWDDGYCISDGAEYDEFVCTEWENGFWIESEEYCAETEEEANCIDNGNFWSEDLFECYEYFDELECNEEGLFWYDGECIESEEVYECAIDQLFYCEAQDQCVENEDECCDEEGLFIEMDGICADSQEMAECLNDGLFWSEDNDECYDLEDEADCVNSGFIWDNFFDECYESEDEINCIENDYYWFDSKCIEFKDVYDCELNNSFYCDSQNDCVELRSECCTNKDLFIESDGTCANSVEEAMCLNKGLVWANSTKECYDPEGKLACFEKGFNWSDKSNICLDNSKKIDCENLDYFWTNGKCVEFEKVYDCLSINKYYCESEDACLSSKSQCCGASNLYLNADGFCETNPKLAKCINDGLYWSLSDNACINLSDKLSCQSKGFNFDAKTNTCLDNQEKIDCKNSDYYWFNNKCYEFEVIYDCLALDQFYCDSQAKCVNSKSQCCDSSTTYNEDDGVCETKNQSSGLNYLDNNKFQISTEKLLSSNNKIFNIGAVLKTDKNLLKNYNCDDYKSIFSLYDSKLTKNNKLINKNSKIESLSKNILDNQTKSLDKYSNLSNAQIQTIYNYLNGFCKTDINNFPKIDDKNILISKEKIVSSILEFNPIVNIVGIYKDGKKDNFYANLTNSIKFFKGVNTGASIEFEINETDLVNILSSSNISNAFYTYIKSDKIKTKIFARKVVVFKKEIDKFKNIGRIQLK